MKCANFLCHDHRSYNKSGCLFDSKNNDQTKDCESRKRYNRIFIRRENHIDDKVWSLVNTFELERDRYYGRDKS